MSFYPFLFGFGGRGRGGRSKGKPKKQPKSNWFEELNATQCKELAKASKVKVSGTKADIVQRLMEHAFVGNFGGNKKAKQWSSGDMYTIDELKDECRKRLLQVGGTKFDLVVRITQHEHGTGGDSLKRAPPTATVEVVGDDGTVQHVAKKRKPSKPSPKTMYSRVQKKIQASCQKKYQSYWGSKAHAPEVCELMSTLLDSLQEYSEEDPKLVFDGCYAIVSAFVENYGDFERPGYCEGLELMAETIVDYTNVIRNSIPQNDLERLARTMLEWAQVASDHFYGDYDMEEAASIICNGPETAVAEDKTPAFKETCASPDTGAVAEDKKPAAKEMRASPDTVATEPSTHSN